MLSTYLFFNESMWLKRFFGFLFIFSVLASDLSSQDIQADWVTGQREVLPHWICSLPEDGTVIAFSNPCMSLNDGRRQAICRALWLFTLQNKVRVQMLSDVFSAAGTSTNEVEKHSDKILSLIMINQVESDYAYEVINEYQTSFGEVALQVRFFSVNDWESGDVETLSLSSKSEWMVLYADDKYAKKEYMIKICMESDEGVTDDFEIKGSLSHLVVSSFFGGKLVTPPRKGCWYKDTFVSSDKIAEGNDLKHAFWVAYVEGLADRLFSYSFSQSKIQSVQDNYQNNIMYDLSREKAIEDISVTAHIQGIRQNKLFVDWEVSSVLNDGKK